MRYLVIIAFLCFLFWGCKKDKFTTEPQIAYKSLTPNVVDASLPFQVMPVLTLEVTDSEGDLGLTSKDTSRIYIKNLVTGKTDSSLVFPDISGVVKRNFQGDVAITIDSGTLLEGTTRPRPKTDTLFYEVYIKDFAKNKSNVIRTNDPVFVIFP